MKGGVGEGGGKGRQGKGGRGNKKREGGNIRVLHLEHFDYTCRKLDMNCFFCNFSAMCAAKSFCDARMFMLLGDSQALSLLSNSNSCSTDLMPYNL